MKKLLLTSALVAVTSTAAVADGSGFFVGVYGGYMGSSTTYAATNLALAPTSSGDLGGNGGQGGLMLGYNYAMDNGAVVGLDVFGQFGSHEAKHTQNIPALMNFVAKHKYAFGIAARFGYMFDTTHAYFRVGYINGRYELTQTSPVLLPVPLSVTNKKNLSGLLLGLGADMPVGEMITVGFNYDFALYKSETVTEPTATGSSVFKPRSHALNVVLKYKF